MAAVLVDSSVWIAFERTPYGLRDAVGAHDVAISPVIFSEVLRGVQSRAWYEKTRAFLLRGKMFDDPTPLARFEEAAQLYLQCRDGGVTPATVDCLIAASAIAHGIPLLTFDADFTHIARYTALKLFTRF